MPEIAEDEMKPATDQSDAQPAPPSTETEDHEVGEMPPADAKSTQSATAPGEVLSRLLQGKEKEWAAVAERNGSLQLLDLPVDILKEIVREVLENPAENARLSAHNF